MNGHTLLERGRLGASLSILVLTSVLAGCGGTTEINININTNSTSSKQGSSSSTATASDTPAPVVTVTAAPLAKDAAFALDEDSPFGGTLEAADSEHHYLKFAIASAPVLGTVTLIDAFAGTFSYLPNANAVGEDVFTFTVDNGLATSNIAKAVLTIRPVNDSPFALDAQVSGTEDQAFSGTLGAGDLDGDALTFSVLQQPARGTVALTDAASGRYVYTPNPNAYGRDTFAFIVSDGAAQSNAGVVTLDIAAVNDPPVAVDDAATVNEGQAVVLGDILKNDSDPDNDSLQVTSYTSPAHGTLGVDAANNLVYTANKYYNGVDSFQYTVSDGHGGTAQAVVTVSVVFVNHFPVAVADAASTVRDTAVKIAVLTNDTELIDTPVTMSVGTLPVNGTATVNGDGTLGYTPQAGFIGDDSFTYRLVDANGDTTMAMVTVRVNCGSPCVRTIEVAWAASAETDVIGYYVYHGMSAGNYSERIWVAVPQISYQMQTAVTGDHYFAISAVNSANMESPLSEPTIINVPIIQ